MLRIGVLLVAGLLAAACSLPIEAFRATAYSEIARVQTANGDRAGARETADRAVATIENMQGEDELLFGIPAAAIAQVRAGDLEGASKTAALAGADEGRVLAYTALALALMDTGHKTEAKDAALQALDAARRKENESKKQEGLVHAAWAQALTGDIAGARQQAESFDREKHRSGLLGLIAGVQLDAGDIAGARATANSITVEEGGSDNDIWLSGIVVTAIAVDSFTLLDSILFENRMPLKAVVTARIAVAQFRAGDTVGARKSFLEATQYAGMANRVKNQIRGVSNVALARARAGDLSGAIESLNYAQQLGDGYTGDDPGGIGRSLDYVLTMRSAISGRGSPDDLLRNLGGASQESAEALVAAALASIQLGRLQRAADYLEAAVDSLPRNSDLSMITAASGVLADKLFRQGDRGGGQAAAKRTLEIAETIPTESEDRVIGLFFASVALARTGDIDLALEAADRIEEPAPKAQ